MFCTIDLNKDARAEHPIDQSSGSFDFMVETGAGSCYLVWHDHVITHVHMCDFAQCMTCYVTQPDQLERSKLLHRW